MVEYISNNIGHNRLGKKGAQYLSKGNLCQLREMALSNYLFYVSQLLSEWREH